MYVREEKTNPHFLHSTKFAKLIIASKQIDIFKFNVLTCHHKQQAPYTYHPIHHSFISV